MISNDLINLIHAYNENGIYFLFVSILWWFNGKRIEKWCYCPDFNRIFVNNGKLYGTSENYKTYILENKHFKSSGLLQEVFKIKDKHIDPWSICFNNESMYSITTLRFKKDRTILPIKRFPGYGFKLLYYDGFLYHFSAIWDGQNEKFNIKTNEWSFFKSQEISLIDDIYLLNNIFYALFENGKIGTYNPQTDTWTLLDINFPITYYRCSQDSFWNLHKIIGK